MPKVLQGEAVPGPLLGENSFLFLKGECVHSQEVDPG